MKAECLIHEPTPALGRAAGKEKVIVNERNGRYAANQFLAVLNRLVVNADGFNTPDNLHPDPSIGLIGAPEYRLQRRFTSIPGGQIPVPARSEGCPVTEQVESLEKIRFSLPVFTDKVYISSFQIHFPVFQIPETVKADRLETQPVCLLHRHENVEVRCLGHRNHGDGPAHLGEFQTDLILFNRLQRF